ncbi:WLM domain-containing protein [Fennellomyces sp. T-0311]|nr:WLM domain-containing protein [Fennellomyces sp. T-0311]
MGDVIQNYTVLKKKRRSDEAMQLLKRIAAQVKPIMVKRGWKVVHLCEFFPKNPSLLGVNVNRGGKINIRLRPHYDDNTFIEYNDLLGTMLHELTHIVRGPHDAVFYKLLDELNDELDELILTGQRGYQPFEGQGNKLGGSLAGDPRTIALIAAEKRRQGQRRMIPVGGVRLGGSSSKNSLEKALSPVQMAARAAERRIRDQMWCGGSQQQDHAASSSSSSSSPEVIIIPDDDDNNDIIGQKRGRANTDAPPAKKPNPSILVPESVISVGWVCAACTFENTDLVLACVMCLTAKPTSDLTKALWSCPQCTLHNEPSTSICSACNFSR